MTLALQEAGVQFTLAPPTGDFDDVPRLLSEGVNTMAPQSNKWNPSRAKEFLCNSAVSKMTKGMLDQIDPNGEVHGWLCRIAALMNAVE